MDFIQDLQELCAAKLGELGYTIPHTNRSPLELLLNIQFRSIEPKKREVKRSKNFCIPSHLERGAKEFFENVEAGSDLTEYMSRKIPNSDFDDMMFNDWRICHFHLSEKKYRDEKNPNLVKGTTEVLFARVTDDTLYAVDIDVHGTWSKAKFMHIIAGNWPELISNSRIHDATLAENISDEDRKTLRKKGCNVFTTTSDGQVFAPVGLGYMLDGMSMAVRREADAILHEANVLQRNFCGEEWQDLRLNNPNRGTAEWRLVECNLSDLCGNFEIFDTINKFRVVGKRALVNETISVISIQEPRIETAALQ